MATYTKPKNKHQRQAMKTGGRILGEILADASEYVTPGMTTQHVDSYIENRMKAHNVKPAFLGYYGFPGHACISVNSEVIHGIPGDTQLAEGDLVSIDCGIMYEGMALDSARTIPVGHISQEAQRLIDVTDKSFTKGVETLKDNVSIGTYGAAVEEYITKEGFGLVRDFCGHGIGASVHEAPNIPNYGQKGKGDVLQEHMTVALEPMVTKGTDNIVVDGDGWTVRTQDGTLSAHYEHTVLITEKGVNILTTV